MAIKNIKVNNFKSFNNLNLDFRMFNVLIGPNASGKSNFIQIFKFLRDSRKYGVDNAISLQGGIEYLRNLSLSNESDLFIELVSDDNVGKAYPVGDISLGIKAIEIKYSFSIDLSKTEYYNISQENLVHKCEFIRLSKNRDKIEEKEYFGEGEIRLRRNKGKIDFEIIVPNGLKIEKELLIPDYIADYIGRTISPKSLLLEDNISSFPFIGTDPFGDFVIYDFDPKLPKKATPITGKVELEEDGSNIAIILNRIIEKEDNKRVFSNLLKDLLPFIDDIAVGKFADKSLLFNIKEKYFGQHQLPASLISDGTINVILLIIALYFGKKCVTIIEEPERNIHPYLISKVIDMMKESSQKKQLFITTHNAEIIKGVNINDVLFVSRDNLGITKIRRPAENESVKVFLKNEMGLDELYIQNLLDI
jgi:predicted ATPase